jgi:Tfp pilus assembly protein PilP
MQLKNSKLLIFLLLIVVSGCQKEEKEFDAYINKKLASEIKVIDKLSNMFPFEWDEACFGSYYNFEVSFLVNKEQKLFLRWKDGNYKIQEDYIPTSLADKCFGRNQRIIMERMFNGKYVYFSIAS